ncbi:hypothetical protein [Natrononativus amylolyticus]|uniref:hypothetical protein n=1 Tax=Natrononativus amylolyticus TaxID=2963434 RepID=UPI0031F31871
MCQPGSRTIFEATSDSPVWSTIVPFPTVCGTSSTSTRASRSRSRHPRRGLLDLADDPDEIDCELEDGPMVRLVDVAETLEALFPETDVFLRDGF